MASLEGTEQISRTCLSVSTESHKYLVEEYCHGQQWQHHQRGCGQSHQPRVQSLSRQRFAELDERHLFLQPGLEAAGHG